MPYLFLFLVCINGLVLITTLFDDHQNTNVHVVQNSDAVLPLEEKITPIKN